MKSISYSPFNRTYKYLCLQNQLAHVKNKKQVKGLVDSNLTVYHDHNKFSRVNPRATFDGSFNWSRSLNSSQCGRLKQEPLTIHKNHKYNSRVEEERMQENARINRKLS